MHNTCVIVYNKREGKLKQHTTELPVFIYIKLYVMKHRSDETSAAIFVYSYLLYQSLCIPFLQAALNGVAKC